MHYALYGLLIVLTPTLSIIGLWYAHDWITDKGKKTLKQGLLDVSGNIVGTAGIFVGATTISVVASLFASKLTDTDSVWFWLFFVSSLLTVSLFVGNAVSNTQKNAARDSVLLTASKLVKESQEGVNKIHNLVAESSLLIKQQREDVYELRELVRTMPPRQFASYLSEYTSRHYQVMRELPLHQASSDDLHKRLTDIIQSILALAYFWDEHRIPSSLDMIIPRLRANVMLVVDINDLDEEVWDELFFDKISFADPDYQSFQRNFDALLSILPELIYNHDAKEPRKEFNLAYRYPAGLADQHRAGLLPGAPRALFDATPMWIPDTHKVVELCRNDVLLEPYLADIDRYYMTDTGARSILSMPLPIPAIKPKYEVDYVPHFGVLNIYKNATGMLGSVENADRFSEVISPLLLLLTDTLMAYNRGRNEPQAE